VDERGRVEPFGAEPIAAMRRRMVSPHTRGNTLRDGPREERAATPLHHMVVLNIGSG
jgi:hypothetical protein